jgi:hypothetical protein
MPVVFTLSAFFFSFLGAHCKYICDETDLHNTGDPCERLCSLLNAEYLDSALHVAMFVGLLFSILLCWAHFTPDWFLADACMLNCCMIIIVVSQRRF